MINLKIAIDCGHTLSGADYGAVGIKAESVLTGEVGTRAISKLKALGHNVINCTIDNSNSLEESLSYRVNQANYNNVDLFASIHFNAYNGQAHGTEVFTWVDEQFQEAAKVLNNLVRLGYKNRGIKDGSNLYVIRNTKDKAMLIECYFYDSKEDMNKYDAEKMANAIVEGITGKTVSNNIEVNKEYDIEKIVTYLGDVDVFAAIMVSQKYRCPLMKYEDFKNLNIKAKEVITIGGTNGTVIGNNRFETFKNAVKLL